MHGITGFVNLNEKLNSNKYIEILNNMTFFENDYKAFDEVSYIDKNICMNSKNGIFTFKYLGNSYSIAYNGNLYNSLELRNLLDDFEFDNSNISDEELVLKAFIKFGYDVTDKLNGAFSFVIWNDSKKELFLVRDHLGIKPLYYIFYNDYIIFSTEIKNLFKFPNVNPEVDSSGISELFGLGPCHTPNKCVFKNINALEPANFAIYNYDGFKLNQYWYLKSKKHDDDFDTTCEKIRNLIEESIIGQLNSTQKICSFLSGGLDSSIITSYISKYFQDNNLNNLDTFSVDYVDNDKNFKATDFQPNSDNYYIELVSKNLNINHKTIYLDTPELAKYLEDALIARDYPGMADVDSSLLLFCKKVKESADIAFSGECADEIFGGYPWFFRDDALNSNTFPWSIALDERQNLLNNSISKNINLKDYVNEIYNLALSKVEFLDDDSKNTREKRKISYLTTYFFMQTLLERSDKMASYVDIELRVPFCNYKIAEYLWNIPWEIKAYNDREKGLLRFIMKDVLPEEIVDRKKSPYPKTCNPTYLSEVKNMLSKIISNSNSPINNLVNVDYVNEILSSDGNAFKRPWFGQLMTGPQLMAYLCQVNMWLEKYNPKISL